ncbi:MAG: hypothetical protein IJS89_02310 [Bacteroidaceae bacterium]|nr:hypothetical protein [Bacteroidaceae bacterium]
MKNTPLTAAALRAALARIEQRQPAAPEGMAERFMERMAQEQAVKGRHVVPARSRRRTLRHFFAFTAAAAAVVAVAVVLWPSQERKIAIPTSPNTTLAEATRQPEAPAALHDSPAAPDTRTIAPTPRIAAKPKEQLAKARSAGSAAAETAADVVIQAAANVPEVVIAVAAATPPAAPTVPAVQTAEAAPPVQALPSQPRATTFTAAEVHLDRLAEASRHSHAYLMLSEELAVQRLGAMELLPRCTAVFNRQEQNNLKPISI